MNCNLQVAIKYFLKFISSVQHSAWSIQQLNLIFISLFSRKARILVVYTEKSHVWVVNTHSEVLSFAYFVLNIKYVQMYMTYIIMTSLVLVWCSLQEIKPHWVIYDLHEQWISIVRVSYILADLLNDTNCLIQLVCLW